MRPRLTFWAAGLLLGLAPVSARANDSTIALRDLSTTVLMPGSEPARDAAQMLSRDARRRRLEADQREREAWRTVQTRAAWERFRDVRLAALRASLGTFPEPPRDLKVRVTGVHDGPSYRVENVVFESRPGMLVTANLYRPANPGKALPGVLICHSHHNPKTQSELQDMGMTWARQGCLVLVMDQLGHGERRTHPFVDAASYAGTFRPSRQDYYFRYNTGIQLHVIGDSLIGWMAWDLMRGVDLLLAQPGIDREKIILLGAVAGGGDPAAVTAALDRRITAAVPFNFGGPQPETIYPLPDDAEASFNYIGGGSWESTRNLRLSARDGFLPWVIVAGIAPRGLVYAHEFAWDRERDPVWKRLHKVYGFYGAADRLASVHGRGSVRGTGPENTHCNNIGPEHRRGIYPALERWFGMPTPQKEFQERRNPKELLCLTPEVAREMKPLHAVAAEVGAARTATARRRLDALSPGERRERLRHDWGQLLGDITPTHEPKVLTVSGHGLGQLGVERVLLQTEPGIVVPLVLVTPLARQDGARRPVVVTVCQQGKQAFLKERADAVAALVAGGAAVCLVDVRGIGETRPGDGRGRSSAATSLSATELMLGQTLLGSRLRDLRAVLRYLRNRDDIAPKQMALWGDSLAPVNAPERDLRVPLDADRQPDLAEPLGDLLALFGALFEDDVKAVVSRGGLRNYSDLLTSPFLAVPHDVVVPRALEVGDLDGVVGALAGRPLRREGQVDGHNRRVGPEPPPATETARWLRDALR